MSKYEIGDRFIVTITNVDDGGMGTEYVLDDQMVVSDFVLDRLEMAEIAPFSSDGEMPVSGDKTYTPDDLLSRILYLCNLLNETTQKYCDMKGILDEGIKNLDKVIEDMRL